MKQDKSLPPTHTHAFTDHSAANIKTDSFLLGIPPTFSQAHLTASTHYTIDLPLPCFLKNPELVMISLRADDCR